MMTTMMTSSRSPHFAPAQQTQARRPPPRHHSSSPCHPRRRFLASPRCAIMNPPGEKWQLHNPPAPRVEKTDGTPRRQDAMEEKTKLLFVFLGVLASWRSSPAAR